MDKGIQEIFDLATLNQLRDTNEEDGLVTESERELNSKVIDYSIKRKARQVKEGIDGKKGEDGCIHKK